uniref:hypothetical protein n=1 Tax=Geminicoccus flavidas TaxID=2506407 RepID=UPI00135A7893
SRPERLRLDLDLHISLVPALLTSHGYASKEIGMAGTRALELCRQIGSDTETVAVLWQMWLFEFMGGKCAAAASLADEMIQ